MILADTTVVVDYERAPSARLLKVITDHDAVICGITVAELFAGVRTPRDETRLQTALADFRIVPIPDAVWEATGRNQAALRAGGVTVPLTDVMIASFAVSLGVELWTYDGHFALMQTVLPALHLFAEPS